jgi:hypothetical protein
MDRLTQSASDARQGLLPPEPPSPTCLCPSLADETRRSTESPVLQGLVKVLGARLRTIHGATVRTVYPAVCARHHLERGGAGRRSGRGAMALITTRKDVQ